MGKRSKASVWDEMHLRAASNAAGIALWSWNMDTGAVGMEEDDRAFWGLPRTGSLSLGDLLARVHSDDVDRVRAAFAAVSSKPGPYEIDFRNLRDGGQRWFSAHGRGNGEGSIRGSMFGVLLDVTDRRQAEEARDLLADEMSHRVKNLFTIASSLTTITARSAATTTEMAHDLRQRLAILGHAHDLIRPDPKRAGVKTAFLGELLTVFLAPLRRARGHWRPHPRHRARGERR